MDHLNDRVHPLEGRLSGEANLRSGGQLHVTAAHGDGVECAIQSSIVPLAHSHVQHQLIARVTCNLRWPRIGRWTGLVVCSVDDVPLGHDVHHLRLHRGWTAAAAAVAYARFRLQQQKCEEYVGQCEGYYADQAQVPWPASKLKNIREKN